MVMYKQIKEQYIEARKLAIKKDNNKSAIIKSKLFSTLIGEIEKVAKDNGQREVTKADCIAVIKKFIKNLLEIKSRAEDSLDERFQNAEYEIMVLEQFLPRQMTENELETAIKVIISDSNYSTIKDMGKIMGQLKKEYNGMYDGGLASKLVRKILS